MDVWFLRQIDYRTIEHPWIINEILDHNLFSQVLDICPILQKKVLNHYPEHLLFWWIDQDTDLEHFLEVFS